MVSTVSNTRTDASTQVSARVAASWGLGSLGTATMLNGVAAILLYFLVTFVKIEPFLAGALLFGSKMLDVVTDPPMGMISDRTRSRFGRRRPWMLGASFFCGLSFAMLFNVPDAGIGTSSVFVSAGLILYALSYTAFQVPYMAMPAEMTDDYHQRTKIMSWRVVFMTFGNLAGLGGVPALADQLGADRAAYGEMGIIIGAFIFVVMLACFLLTGDARQTQPTHDEHIPLRRQLSWLLDNKPLLIMIGTKVAIVQGRNGRGRMELHFYSNEEMERVYEVLMKVAGSLAARPKPADK